MSGANRDGALNAIGSILDGLVSPLMTRISVLESEKEKLQEKVDSLSNLLLDKERECEETMAVLRRKTSQWAEIKARLSKYKSIRSLFPPDPSFTMDVDAEPESTTAESTTQGEEEKSSISTTPSADIHTQLDCLIDLAQGEQGETEGETEIESAESNLENVSDSFNSTMSRPSSITPLLAVTKRKGHKRGCPCCEKATRSPTRKNYLQEAYDRVDAHEEIASTPPGFWDVNFTPKV